MSFIDSGIFRRLRQKLSGARGKDGLKAVDPELERLLGYRFKDRSLLVGALMHRSYSQDRPQANAGVSNERMEFLGDSVLSLVVNEYLYAHYRDKTEGELTKMKSVIVSKSILSHYAKLHGLGSFILMSEHAYKAGVDEADSVLADTFEAIFGAVFLDGGFEAARGCIRDLLLSDVRGIFHSEKNINFKSLLQEYVQALHKVPPRYRVAGTAGPEHQKEFAVEGSIRGQAIATGMGKTKKLAEQEAARVAYKKLLNADGLVDEP
jgi:ribonuclease-3